MLISHDVVCKNGAIMVLFWMGRLFIQVVHVEVKILVKEIYTDG